ncbi:hypothetical protein [Methyloversatilis sp.]|uniref:hypothetical protein n=1 Tax=Methyloversatilis sp. TaxID=2569862 RepID=UPI0035B220FB
MTASKFVLTNDEFAAIYNDEATYPTLEDVASAMGMTVQQVKNKAAGLKGHFNRGYTVPHLKMRTLDHNHSPVTDAVEIEQLPSSEEDIEDLIARAIAHNEALMEYEERRQLVDVNLHIEGPFGVVGLPDQHLNNPGTKLGMAIDHARLIRDTDGLFCIAVGDWLDNFIIGRLERERRGDKMSHEDGNRIQEYYLNLIGNKLIAAIGGNHNDWVGSLGGHDLLGDLIKRVNRSNVYHPDQVRVRLNTKDGGSFIHLVRHIFPGHSKYNTAHGVLSWMLDRWQGEDVLWGGHIHSSAHIAIEREHLTESKVVHGVQLATYKLKDGYAEKRGFRKNVPFIAPMVVHDPRDGSTVFFEDIYTGIKYLRAIK